MISKDTKSKCTNLSWFLKNVIRQSADLITLDKKKVKPSEDNLLPPTPPPQTIAGFLMVPYYIYEILKRNLGKFFGKRV